MDSVDTIQRLQKFKWSAYSLKAPTEKNSTTLNPQYVDWRFSLTISVISAMLTKELEPLVYCVHC